MPTAQPSSRSAAKSVAARRLELGDIPVAVNSLPLPSEMMTHDLACVPEMPEVVGRRFFLTATTVEEIENASPFQDALDGKLENIGYNPDANSTNEDGTDPARSLYLLLMPPLEDVFKRGIDLPYPLYGYQAEGVSFLAKRKYALLADDMGLGKTVQTIVAARVLLGSGFVKRLLIICPAGLKSNWKSEFETWAPEVAVQIVGGTTTQRRDQWDSPAHVLIANYESVRNDADLMPSKPFDLIVLDEAQRIKNAETNTSQAIKAIPRRAAWCLTGTPIENSLNDLASILSFLKPDMNLSEDTSPEDARRQVAPLLLRREKKVVLKDLPQKREHTALLELTDEQAEAYAATEEAGDAFLRNLGETVTLQHVLAQLTRLKQICNFDPETGASAKLDYLRESMEAIAESGEKALVFSQYTRTLDFIAENLPEYRSLQYHGGLSRNQKDAVIEEFKQDDGIPLLLISLQAGGVGLNLQEASYVYHFDRWWNPAVERQAEDRAYRLGQKREVLVTRLVIRDTIEERIDKVLKAKEALFRRFMDEQGDAAPDAAPAKALTDSDYFNLVGLSPILSKVRRHA
ncbi:MAG: DEAD/DEAH box helicase [Candidatus Poribacteria bacterium]|nr:DEAD/DEAH box helicase [Candidatus Poribacteria bacterium]